ncbi:leucine rich repeat domain-containing protein [Phthorimaea operculella]|nr:leucine rich repeat domain-containing protein [Phthorimaea operculella]
MRVKNEHVILNDECYYHINNERLMYITKPKVFSFRCPQGVWLNSTSLPIFQSHEVVSWVILDSCPLPDESYTDALRRLNVTVVDHLTLNVPGGHLRDDHFHNLTELTELNIRANKPIVFENDGALTPLQNLKKLWLKHLQFPSGLRALENLTSLETLQLDACNITELPKNVLCKLPALNKLTIDDNSLTSILDPEEPCNITTVSLSAKNLTSLPSFDAVKSILLKTNDLHILKGCSQLENLTVINSHTTTLPDKWLVQCRQLKRLTLNLQNLKGPLPDDLLSGAVALQEFKLSNSKGIQLTNDLFRNTRKLKTLNLSKNKLKELPRGVFSSMELETLDLSHNQLTADALLELQGQTSLRTLMLQNNPLGDLCKDQFVRSHSTLDPLRSLRELSLANTNATRICTDWRLYMHHLNKLYLEDNHINILEWQDLQGWNRDVEVRLKRNGNFTVEMYKNNYENPRYRSGSTVKFVMDQHTPLVCDCRAYWFARAVRQQLLPVTFEDLRCLGPNSDTDYIDSYETGDDSESNPNLLSFDLDLMVCFISDGCPESCSCIFQPQNASILIECTDSETGILPSVNSLGKEFQNNTMMMRVINRNLTVLPESISPQVRKLDVRNNSLRVEDLETARALVAGGRQAWLAGNPLDCRCGGPLLRVLRTRSSQIMDVDDARCADGRPLSDALSTECVVAGAFLLARGLCLRWVLPDDDDDCKYDAFLSYAHEDEELACALVAELESGPRPLHVCVHHRDWRPGEWIPKQIAQSVKESRRTIILLSENFAKSSWARAEFREAYAHALREDAVRLVVVVVGAAPPADLDPDIQHYVANNTYVRWGEPAFWEKLRLALPAGRLRVPPLQTSLKFANIDFPAPIKPAKNSAPPCA